MARLLSTLPIEGSLGQLSAYRMRGSDKIIVRLKGGPSKERIKRDANFANTRRINSEFGGRAAATKILLQALSSLRALADHNIAGPLNALIKPIQALDTVSDYGKRNLYFTKDPGLLKGFNLNRKNNFDSIVRNPVEYELSKDNLSVRINIPTLIPGINFVVPAPRHPLYSIEAVLALVPDLLYDPVGYQPAHQQQCILKQSGTPWQVVVKPSQPTTLELSLAQPDAPASSYSVMLSIGIRFGVPVGDDRVQQIKYAGAAKVLAVK